MKFFTVTWKAGSASGTAKVKALDVESAKYNARQQLSQAPTYAFNVEILEVKEAGDVTPAKESPLDRAIGRLRTGAKNEHPMLVGTQLLPEECVALLKALGLRVEP